MKIFLRLLHPEKADLPILETPFGIKIFSIKKHSEKALSPISLIRQCGIINELIFCSINVLLFNILIDSGSLIPNKIFSPKKTCLPIISMTFGIVIFVSDEHSEKILFPSFSILFGIVIFVSDEHSEKALLPIFLTPLGIDIFVSAEHSLKAPQLILIKLLGKRILESDLQAKNVQDLILIIFSGTIKFLIEEQHEKALLKIKFTLFEIAISERALQPLKACE